VSMQSTTLQVVRVSLALDFTGSPRSRASAATASATVAICRSLVPLANTR